MNKEAMNFIILKPLTDWAGFGLASDSPHLVMMKKKKEEKTQEDDWNEHS